MVTRDARRARRLFDIGEPVPDRIGRCDYADAFAVAVDSPPPTAEVFARRMFEQAPYGLPHVLPVAWRGLVRLRLRSHRGADNVLGWPILESEASFLHLGTTSPIAAASLICRIEEGEAVFTSFVRFERPRLVGAIWKVAGPLHRAIVPFVMTRAAR